MPAPNGSITAINGAKIFRYDVCESSHKSNSQRRASTRSSSCASENSVADLAIKSASVE